MEQRFKVGDVVVLKGSSRPPMTVSDFDEDGVVCRWFDGDTLEQDCFKPASLKQHDGD